jgi:bifunctional DNase/RNase
MLALALMVEMTVAAVAPTHGGGAAVLLVDPSHTRVLPIFVGGTEALSIDLRMRKQKYQRPLTHDLLDSVLRELGGKLVRVQVDELREEVFIGSVFIETGGRTVRIDARPSDAIALALGAGVPILVARKVLDAAGVSPDSLAPPPAPAPSASPGPI